MSKIQKTFEQLTGKGRKLPNEIEFKVLKDVLEEAGCTVTHFPTGSHWRVTHPDLFKHPDFSRSGHFEIPVHGGRQGGQHVRRARIYIQKVAKVVEFLREYEEIKRGKARS